MKRSLYVLLGVLALLAVLAVPSAVTQAATGALCWSNPTSGPIGTVFQVNCTGFTPNTQLFAYYVEPDGTAVAYDSLKSDAGGAVSFSLNSNFGTEAAPALGDWKWVVEQTGLAKSVIYRGIATFRVTGGTEGVSGATLWTDKSKVTKNESVNIYGSGFAPYEMVTVWWEYPNGDCSTFTAHDFFLFNYPQERGFSSLFLFDTKADAAGNISDSEGWTQYACEGKYRLVARGNTSRRGAETWVSVTGNAVTTNAWLYSSKSLVYGLFDTVSFNGSGFGSGEHVTCWVRTPQGQVSAIETTSVKADTGGAIGFSIYTGSLFPGFALTSEGATGEYAVTCRGDSSGATAIATFMVTGNPVVDP